MKVSRSVAGHEPRTEITSPVREDRGDMIDQQVSTDAVTTNGAQLPVPPKISAVGVERCFGTGNERLHALGPFDLEVAEGEFVCIVGPSGCGKSTFLRLVADLLRPTSGRITLRSRTAGNAIAVVFQDYAVYPWKRVLDNVRFGLDAAGVPRKEGNKRARHYLAKLGLADRERSYPDTLSGGMKQRVAIARALAVEPEILLMDEPFAALDAQMRQIMQEELLQLWQADRRTVLFVTHSLDEAILLGDRVVVMSARPGRLVKSVPVPFPRPRDAAVRNTEAFAALRDELWQLLREEVESQFRTAGRAPTVPNASDEGEVS